MAGDVESNIEPPAEACGSRPTGAVRLTAPPSRREPPWVHTAAVRLPAGGVKLLAAQLWLPTAAKAAP